MTAEATAIENLSNAQSEEEKETLNADILRFRALKEGGQQELMSVSEKYKNQMIAIRLSAQ